MLTRAPPSRSAKPWPPPRASDDLTEADRSRVSRERKRRYLAAKDDLDCQALSFSVGEEGPVASTLRGTVSVEQALEEGVPTLEELYEGL